METKKSVGVNEQKWGLQWKQEAVEQVYDSGTFFLKGLQCNSLLYRCHKLAQAPWV